MKKRTVNPWVVGSSPTAGAIQLNDLRPPSRWPFSFAPLFAPLNARLSLSVRMSPLQRLIFPQVSGGKVCPAEQRSGAVQRVRGRRRHRGSRAAGGEVRFRNPVGWGVGWVSFPSARVPLHVDICSSVNPLVFALGETQNSEIRISESGGSHPPGPIHRRDSDHLRGSHLETGPILAPSPVSVSEAKLRRAPSRE